MVFFRKNKTPHPKGRRVVLIVGGSGLLGTSFLEEQPKDIFVINIGRNKSIERENVFTIQGDILVNPEEILEQVSEITNSVEVLINMAYSHLYSSIDKLNRNDFLREIELNTFTPIHVSKLCGDFFWSRCNSKSNFEKGRKVINISSGAAFWSTDRPELASYSGTKAALNIMTEYLHNYLYANFGVSAHIVAPGSLQDNDTLEKTVRVLWNLQSSFHDRFTVQKIF